MTSCHRAAVAAFGACVLVCGLAPLQAAEGAFANEPAPGEDRLLVSRDGAHWSNELESPVFADHLQWVPGDVRTATFYVQNHGGTDARLSVRTDRMPTSNELQEPELLVEARADGGAWKQIPMRTDAAEEASVGLGIAESADRVESSQIEVRASFSEAAANQTQRQSAQLAFTVILEGSVISRNPVPGTVASTGGSNPVWVGAVAAAALGVGAAMIGGSWRECIRRSEP